MEFLRSEVSIEMNLQFHGVLKGTPSKKKKLRFKSLQALRSVPFADKRGVVLKYKRLKFSHVSQAYNPSIVKTETGYLVAFRNDKGYGGKRQSSLAAARVDPSFRQVGNTVFFHTNHAISEDPRCLCVNGRLYLMYTHTLVWSPYETYTAMAKLNPSTLRLSAGKDLQYHPQHIEKNWVPFAYNDLSGTDIYFVYSFNPYKVVRLAKTSDGAIEQPFPQAEKRDLEWESKWGRISGGTPALLVNNEEYLTFFHSYFEPKKNVKWYVMGAYTFSKTPPFQIRRISRYPIIFKKMYRTRMHPKVWFHPKYDFHVVFPGGFVESKENQKDVFHLAFGENDSGLCILTLDKERLLNSLQNIDDA
jgi:predicted GH43/DUF377 family glycosyl hydrolase